ncbi:hypothetical protein CMQ_1347 [Grosmannia clavigera kw1407]|uniref:Uncharacterized protein n=1 Tax=Grosmannia clavigera (strain kw1407 / UAMH 11150) TaxID=655863 RepID=F0XD90_GROCL|nr:uncharacterized protein CMQ_1347 [Grosmannia clavigera kw1407]EFX04419.1 hypothetical protein CMQ_1347 [Grosmannia clavigera kw1407]
MNRATMLKPLSSPGVDRPRASRQSVRGRISAPIPMPDPLDLKEQQSVPSESGAVHESCPSPMPKPVQSASFDPESAEVVPVVAAPVENAKSASVPDASGPPATTFPPASASLLPSPLQREAGTSSPASASQLSPASTPQPRPLSKRPPPHAIATSSTLLSDSPPTARGSKRVSSALQQRAPPNNVRYSEASARSENPRISQSRDTGSDIRPQRKKSGFRGAFSKLFSRRKHVDSLPPPSSQASHYDTPPLHRSVRSDPTVLSISKEAEPGRSTSLPLSEYGRALRSHSVGPGAMSIIDSVRTSLHADGPSTVQDDAARSRSSAATATTVTRMRIAQHHLRRGAGGYGSSGDILGGGEWAGLSPRPASVHARATHHPLSSTGLGGGAATSRGNLAGNVDGIVPYRADEIGRAITSDLVGATDLGLRRRSRSLSGLRDLTFGRDRSRRRSDEIRYWRESYDPTLMSPLSDEDADGPETRTGHADDNGIEGRDGDDDDDDIRERDLARRHSGSPSDFLNNGGLSGALLPSLPATPGSPDSPNTAMQPFSFGNLSGLPEMPHTANMNSRLDMLESRMHRVEHVVDQLFHAVAELKEHPRSAHSFANDTVMYTSPSATATAEMRPIYTASTSAKHRFAPAASSRCSSRHSDRSGNSTASFDSDMHQSHLSFGEGRTYIGSLHPPSTAATQVKPVPMPAFPPSVAATVREAASLPALGASIGRGTSPASAAEMAAQLEAERAARQTLEAQVKKLNDRINVLSTTMYAIVRDPAAQQKRSLEPLSSPVSSTGSIRDAVATKLTLPQAMGKLERPSTREDGSSNVDPSGGDSPEQQRKTSRTLSLGQLTLGKSAVRA